MEAKKKSGMLGKRNAPASSMSGQMTEAELKTAMENLKKLKTGNTEIRDSCPYLSQIKKYILDFDYEKFCSISLNKENVYCCLVCGKYYQGKGKKTYAYLHSLEHQHHLFINLNNTNVYCLPDNYEFDHPILEPIKFNLKPSYKREDIVKMRTNTKYSRSLDGVSYLPGTVGLNNVKNNDYVNVILQCFCRMVKLREYFLEFRQDDIVSDVAKAKKLISIRLAELFKKIWNPINFKSHVSPHELLQAISIKSRKRFTIGEKSDPAKFLIWILNTMHRELRDKNDRSIISDCFRGELEVTTHKREYVNSRFVDKGWVHSLKHFL